MTPEQDVKVTFEQEKKDIIAFGFIQHKREPAAQFFSSKWAVIIMAALVGHLCYGYLWLQDDVPYGVILAVISYGLFLSSFHSELIYGLLFWPRLKRSQMAVRGPVEVVLNKEKIIVRATGTAYEQMFSWHSFDACVAGPGYFFLFGASGSGILFPKRAFLLEQEAYDFVSYLQHNLTINNK
jgi:hypothetical protein